MKLNFVGDIMLGRGIESVLLKDKGQDLIHHINKLIPNSEAFIANLEAPYSLQGTPLKLKDPHLTFKIDPKQVDFLKKIGISCVTLANNHITDFGKEGLVTTIDALNRADIKHTGAGRDIKEAIEPIYFINETSSIALIAFNAFVPFNNRARKKQFGTARFDRKTLANAIKGCENQVDGIIVSVHWGIDYHPFPVPALLAMAKELIDKYPKIIAIIGHHPHLQQPIIHHKDKPIFCSLGNFVFDEPFPLSRIGSILSLNFDGKKITDYSIKLTTLNEDFTIEELKDPLASKEVNRLNEVLIKIKSQDKTFLQEDNKWMKYLIYQSLRYFSFNDLTYLFENYSFKGILKNLLAK